VSTSDKPDTARGWRFVEKLLADEDIERLDKASDEEVERQMEAQGVRVGDVPTAEQLLAKVTDRASKRGADQAGRAGMATVRPLRRVRLVALLAAAAIGGLAVVLVTKRPEVDTAPPSRADALRSEAFDACARADWTLCENMLDEAKGLDPKGEQDQKVETARRQIYGARHPEEGSAPPEKR
jgi:hypothetical protein